MNESRLIEIESKLAYQEDTIHKLNEVVCQQQTQINQLETTCKILIDRIREMSEKTGSDKILDEKPPHY